MNFKSIVEALEETILFKDFKKNRPESYLVHIFVMMDEANKGLFQIGYLDPKTDKVTSFTYGNKEVQVNPESEVLKEPEATIFPLDIEKVEQDEEQVLRIVDEFVKLEYPKVMAVKRFYILQHLDIGQVFNFTIVTMDFKTLNLKIDVTTGEMLRHSLKSLLAFDKE